MFESAEQREMVRIAAAGVALHGLICSGVHMGHQDEQTVAQAFRLGDLFIAEAERRLQGP
jgi:hypothetical protein